MFGHPPINTCSDKVARLVRFYEGHGCRESLRTPDGSYVEVNVDGFTPGIAPVAAAMGHGLSPNPQGRPVELSGATKRTPHMRT